MRVVFDLVNGEYADVPDALPDWLVPEGKAHLVQAGRAVRGGAAGFERPQDQVDGDDGDGDGEGLRDGFDWYMAPAQKAQYEDIYAKARDAHGYVAFAALEGLYASLEVPDTDVRSAWNLVNPAADEVIGKDACLAFLHVLRGRHEGFRLPRSVPPSLRASFERGGVEFNVDRVRARAGRGDDDTSTGRKAKFGDAYLARLGTGGAGAYRNPKGTDFSNSRTTEDWEEVRLKKQLKELESKIEKVEAGAAKRREKKAGAGARRNESKPALVKRELEQLLEYKRKELRSLQDGEGKENKGMQGVEEEIGTVREQVEGLEQHLKRREEVLEDLRRQIREEKGR